MIDHNSQEAVEARKNQPDPIVMYLIVRESLGMSCGKIAAQCAHASQMILLKYQEEMECFDDSVEYPHAIAEQLSLFKEWLRTSFRKVVLRAKESEWQRIMNECSRMYNECSKMYVIVTDAGLTEVEPGTDTVIGLFPMRKSEVPKIIKRLQVLK